MSVEDWSKASLVALDWEMTGCDPEVNFPVAAGVTMRVEGKISKHLVKFPVPCFPAHDFKEFKDQPGWEERCVREFWSTLSPELLDQLRHPDSLPEWPKDATPEQWEAAVLKMKQALQAFMQWVRHHIESMPEEPILLTDNGVYDWPIANYYIHRYRFPETKDSKEARPLSYRLKWGYMGTYDVGDMLRPFDKKAVKEIIAEDTSVKHNHVPDEDAAMIVRKFEIATELTAAMKPFEAEIFASRKRKLE